MSNRNLKIIAVILSAFIAVCTVTNCYMRSSAAEIAATGYTVEKVLAVLLAVAGVALSESDYHLIWQGGQLDTSALLNNMQQYSRSLYNAVSNAMYLGAAGVTKITLQQDIMSLLKTWAQQYFGTSVGTSNIFGTGETEVELIKAGTPVSIAYSYTQNGTPYEYSCMATFNVDMIAFLGFYKESNTIFPWRYFVNFTPLTPTLSQNITYHVTNENGEDSGITWSYTSIGNNLGDMLSCMNGSNQQTQFSTFMLGVGAYNYGIRTSNYKTIIAEKLELYLQSGKLTQEENIDGTVLDNDGQAATLGGVIGAGTTAALDALGNVALAGQATITLPSDETMEDDLTDVVTGILPWTSFLEKLGLIAITGAETAEQINEQAQSLPTPSYSGAYTLDLTGLFPFCIPFDIVRILSAFNAPAEAPHFNWTLPTGYQNGQVAYETYTIDLSQFDTVAQVVRVFEYISFVLGLAIITRDLIRG